MPKVNAVLDHMKEFTAKVVNKEWKVMSHSGLSIIDHVSVLENFDGLKNHFLVVQHIVRYINIHTNECS